jgi:hypothetical protein
VFEESNWQYSRHPPLKSWFLEEKVKNSPRKFEKPWRPISLILFPSKKGKRGDWAEKRRILNFAPLPQFRSRQSMCQGGKIFISGYFRKEF